MIQNNYISNKNEIDKSMTVEKKKKDNNNYDLEVKYKEKLDLLA